LVNWEKRTQNEPKRTQFQKGQNDRKLCCDKGLQKSTQRKLEKKQTQFKANLAEAKNERNRLFYKVLREKPYGG